MLIEVLKEQCVVQEASPISRSISEPTQDRAKSNLKFHFS